MLTADTPDLGGGALSAVIALVREHLEPLDAQTVTTWLHEAVARTDRRRAAATEELAALELAEQLLMKYGDLGSIPTEDVGAIEEHLVLAERLGSVELRLGVPADYRLENGRRVSATRILGDEDLQASFLSRAEEQLLAWAQRPMMLERRGAERVHERLGLVLWAVRQLVTGAT